MESNNDRVGGNSYEESGKRFSFDNVSVQNCQTGRISDVEAATVIRGSNSRVEMPQMPSGVAGIGTRKKTIVRKTVIVVKKLVKRRVPKRVLVNRTKVVNLEDRVGMSEVRNDRNLANDVSEKSNVVDEVIEDTGRESEAKDAANANTVNDITENLNLENDADMRLKETTSIVHDNVEKVDNGVELSHNVEIVNAPNLSRPVIGEEVDDVSASMESEMLNPNFTEQIVLGNCKSGLNSTDADDVKGNGAVCEVEIKDLTKPFSDVIEVENVNFTLETTVETNGRENTMTEDQIKDCLMENQRIDIARKTDTELLKGQNVGLGGGEIRILGGRENGRSTVQAESCNGDVESNSVQLNEGLLFSEETEALERKKKRKREIFVGGLDMYNTKEEDIRKAFKDVGLVEEVRVVKKPKSVKNRGFAFVRFATAVDAKNALAKYTKVEICGKRCNIAPVEGNDTIFLDNIDRNWKTEDVMKLLEKVGIEKIDKVTFKADPNNTERNRGFAFVELQTSKDAQIAFKKLQKKDIFGKKQVVKVAWAQPITEPTEEEIIQVKSVYAECLPSSWDEEKVKKYFKRFGEIESVALAKDLSSSRRQDFAFINYATRDAALTCLEVVNRERLEDDCSKVKIVVSLAKSNPKRTQSGDMYNPISRQHLEAKAIPFQTSKQLHGPRNNGNAVIANHVKVDSRPSTTDELVQLLRQQASIMHNPPHPSSGTIVPDHRFPLHGSKRPFSQVGHGPLYLEHQGLPRVRVERSYQISGPSSLSHGADILPSPYHHQSGRGLQYESSNGRIIYPRHFQTRDRASFYEDTNPYHRY